MILHVVLGVAFLRFYTRVGQTGTMAGLVLAHLVIVMSFALRLSLATCTGLDPRIEQAVTLLGGGRWVTFRRITFFLILPGGASGWLLA